MISRRVSGIVGGKCYMYFEDFMVELQAVASKQHEGRLI